MPKMLLLALTLVSLPGLALAEPGSGTDRTRVNTAVEAMQRDGRWERLIAEGRANKRAFEDLRQAEQRVQTPSATGSIGVRPRR